MFYQRDRMPALPPPSPNEPGPLRLCCAALILFAATPAIATDLQALPPLPDPLGFAGMYAGVSGGALLAAGGANFPEKPLAQGGRKVWHDGIYVLQHPRAAWRFAGRLPKPAGYGVSATWGDAVILAGGGNDRGSTREVLSLRWDNGMLRLEPLPSLPIATANCCGTVVGDVLYVAGGQESPVDTRALARCFALSLSEPPASRIWREIPWPEQAPGRILAVAASAGGYFYLFSGMGLSRGADGSPARTYLTDAWRYLPSEGWRRLTDMPRAAGAAPSPAHTDASGRILITGGVHGDFLAKVPKGGPFPGFPRDTLAYDPAADAWDQLPPAAVTNPGSAPPARVTAPVAIWNGRVVVPGGEIEPGIRTPTVEVLP